jgi:hypothetical protein
VALLSRRRLPDPEAGEAELERWLCREADAAGWCGYRVRISLAAVGGIHHLRTDGHDDSVGFPDYVLAKQERPPLFLELKGASGRKGPGQQRWVELLKSTRGDAIAGIVYPSDAQTVLEVLRR